MIFYPNFNETNLIDKAQSKVKNTLAYPSLAGFSSWEAQAWQENNGDVFAMASGIVSVVNIYGVRIKYIYYVKFKIDVENNTYSAYTPTRQLY